MASNKKILSNIANDLNLNFINKFCIAYGTYQEYLFFLKGSGISDRKQYIIISFCVNCENTISLRSVLNLPRQCDMQTGNYKADIRIPIGKSNKYHINAIKNLLQDITTTLATYAFFNCDEQGNTGIIEVYNLKGEYVFLTNALAEEIQYSLEEEKIAFSLKKENYLLGIIGACIGGILASVLIFFIARIGYVTSLGYAFMGIGVVYGYKYKGIKISKISACICILISVIFSYFVFRLDMAVSINETLNLDLVSSFLYCKEIAQLADGMHTYYENLALIAVGNIFTTIVATFSMLSSQKKQFQIKKLI